MTDDTGTAGVYRISLGVVLADRTVRYEATGTVDAMIDPSGADRSVLDVAVKTWIDDEEPYVSNHQVTNGGRRVSLSKKRPLFDTAYLPSMAGRYTASVNLLANYIARDGKSEILRMLRTFDGNIDDISIVGEDIYLHNGRSGTLPLFAYGSGMQKAVSLVLSLMCCDNGAILVDEIDSAIHISAFEDVFHWFLDACREKNVQAFVTTHSAEALDAILKITRQYYRQQDFLRVITLRKDAKTDVTRAKIRSGEQAYEDRSCFEMELRV